MKFNLAKPGLISVVAATLAMAMTSCYSTPLTTRAVTYQALRLEKQKNPANADNAEIVVLLCPTLEGELDVIVKNQANTTMIIDQTLSTFINTDGRSTTYFDPTVRTVTNTETHSGSSGASVNLGSVAGALGIGGVVGGLLGGVNVGGGSSNGTGTAETTYFADTPRITIGPKGSGAMSKTFTVTGLKLENTLDTSLLDSGILRPVAAASPDHSPLKFTVTIVYSVDNGASFKEITTTAYLSTQMIERVPDTRMINNSVRNICTAKPDALSEFWWRFGLLNNQCLTKLENIEWAEYYDGQYVGKAGALINYK